MNLRHPYAALPAALLLVCAVPAPAALPVIDIASLGQLVSQLRTLQEQLATTRDQLTQARSTLASLTGPRGMEQLLAGTARNYLPASWTEISDVLANTSARYSALASDVQDLIAANAVLPAAAVAGLSATQRQLLESARQDAAGLAALTRSALATSSQRFASLQQLIDAIGTASDPKAVYDLQARVQAEAGMLQNEATKLQSLYQAESAQAGLRTQRIHEQAIADVGSLRALPALGLP
jgi:type IV secretion system protein VirB5